MSGLTTGNSAAVGMNAASMAPAVRVDDECKELDEKNKADRASAIEEMRASDSSHTVATSDAIQKAEGAGMTFASASVKVSTASGEPIVGIFSGCSSGKAQEFVPSSVVEGGSSGMKAGTEPILCGEAKYQHKPNGYGSHAEAKIFNHLTEMAKSLGGMVPGGKILLNVDWRYSHGSDICESGMPCVQCYRMMCAAFQDCKFTIEICDDKGNAHQLDPKNNCKEKSKDPQNSAYKSLDSRTGEDAKKGRGVIGCV
jgi:hypothetical protein